MNTENLKKLQQIAKGVSLLYVEDSITLQKQVAKFLSKIFDDFYQAFDGQEGLEIYKEHKPDIIITDITMPNLNGIDMITQIKMIEPNIKVIILSAHNDDVTLLQTIDLGIIDFILKPLDMDKLTQLLINAIEGIEDTEENGISQCMKDLTIIKEQNAHVDFIGSFKGVPIQTTGSIIDINDNKITAKLSHTQAIVMKYERYSIIELKATNRHVKAMVESVNEENDTAVLCDPQYISFTVREFQFKRLKVDSSFKIGLHFKNHAYKILPIDTSFFSIGMIVDEENPQLKLDDEMDITLAFEVEDTHKTSMTSEKKHAKIFARAKVIRIDNSNGNTLIVVSVKIKKADETIFSKYLIEREKAVLQELKALLRK